MPSAFASFASGLFVATLVLTHDATFGDEILLARGLLARAPRPVGVARGESNVVMPTSGGFLGTLHGAPGETSTVASDASTDASSDPDDWAGGEIAFRPPPVADAADGVPRASTSTTTSPTTSRRVPPPRAVPSPSDAFAANLTTRESFAAAMASTKLALTLWARTARPATDALSRYARAGASEMTDAAWRFLRDTHTRGRSRRLRVAPHLRRRRLRRTHPRPTPPPRAGPSRRARAAARARTRAAASLRRRASGRFSPRRYVRATLRPRRRGAIPRLHTRREGQIQSRRRARAARHRLRRGRCARRRASRLGQTIREETRSGGERRSSRARLRDDARARAVRIEGESHPGEGKATRRRRVETTRRPGLDGFGSDLATSTDAAELWLRFWASAAPLMFALDLPFAAYAVHAFCPAWPELTLLWTAWLTFPMSRGAVHHARAVAPHVARGGSGTVGVADPAGPAGRRVRSRRSWRSLWRAAGDSSTPRRFERSVRSRGRCVCPGSRASAALSLALDNTTLPMVGCVLFFFTPSFLTSYGCAVAALAIPAAASLDALSLVDAEGRPRTLTDRADRVCAQLRYWLVLHGVVAGARAQRGAPVPWFPLWRHAELASAFYLSVFEARTR